MPFSLISHILPNIVLAQRQSWSFLSCAVLAGMLGLLLSASQRLNPPVRTALTAVLFTASWAVGAMMFAGWMITENAGATWLWHEPFTELFWHPIFTPVVFLTALMLALRDGTLR
jgi:hypothetical protein